jgi:hypothetical protein
MQQTLNSWQCVAGESLCPWAREGLEEVCVFEDDEPYHGEELHCISARFYALQNLVN